ncbi:MAG: ABC transporter permease [Frankiales bacterium]|nr:ABC transporter permease [Frankiales bacterium]
MSASTVTTGPAVPARPPGAFALGRRRVSIELKQFFRDRQSAVFNFLLPVLLMVIFGAVFGSQPLSEGSDIAFSQYFVAGMIASGVLYTSFQNLSISIPLERDDGTLKRIQGTPMPKLSYFIGKIGLVFVAYVAQLTLLVTVGRLFYKLQLPSGSQWVTLVWVSVLGLIACTLLGIAFSSVPKNGKGAPAIVSPIVLVLQFTSGVFFPYSQLPDWMQTFAAVFPLKWLTQAMRSVFLPPEAAAALEVSGSWQLGACAAVLAAWAVVALLLSLRFFRWNKRGQD